jgi:Rrf2 family protein
MLGFTRKVDYALVALARLAEQDEAHESPLSARQIADEFGLPQPLLMNILKDLQRCGVIGSTRGARGGYYLAEAPANVSVISIIECMEGPVQITPCCSPSDEPDPMADALDVPCRIAGNCPISRPVRRLHQRIVDYLSDLTLEALFNEQDLALAEASDEPAGAGSVD